MGYWDFFGYLRHKNEIRFGNLVGTDRFGNKYFENMEYQHLRTRWVEYAKPGYQAGQPQNLRSSTEKTEVGWATTDNMNSVPPDWHGWLHGYTHENPSNATFAPEGNVGNAFKADDKCRWGGLHQYPGLNPTGSPAEYRYLNPGHPRNPHAVFHNAAVKNGSYRPTFQAFDPNAPAHPYITQNAHGLPVSCPVPKPIAGP